MIDPFEIHRRQPSHQQRLATEKQVNVYYIPGNSQSGSAQYVFAVCSAMLHEQFLRALGDGDVPDYAVIVARGDGEPDEATLTRMETMYGFVMEAGNAA